MEPLENNTNEKPVEAFVDRDILGQEKPAVNPAMPAAKPNRIFIGLTVIVILALIYWLLTK